MAILLGVASLLLQSCTLDFERCSRCQGAGELPQEVEYYDYALEYSTRNLPRWCRPSGMRTRTEYVECPDCKGIGTWTVWR